MNHFYINDDGSIRFIEDEAAPAYSWDVEYIDDLDYIVADPDLYFPE